MTLSFTDYEGKNYQEYNKIVIEDFTRIKKGKDRFNASNNDMQHAISAIGVNFLISSDVNFLKKVQACYAYVDCQTIACSPKDFIETYCKFA